MIRDTAEAFLSEISPAKRVRESMVLEKGYEEQAWQRICSEMGWSAMIIPDEYDGLGLGYVELVATMEQMGRHLLCSPFYASVCLATNLILLAGTAKQKADLLPRLASGSTATLAYAGSSQEAGTRAIEATWVKTPSEGYQLNGGCRYVVDGHSAEHLIVAAREAGNASDAGIRLFLIAGDHDGLSRSPLPTMDQTRRLAEVKLDGVEVAEEAVLAGEGASGESLHQTLDLAAIALAAEQLGGAQAALDKTVEYVKERKQFGRSIASYQAVKHKAADMMLKVEAARSGVYYAACIADEFIAGRPLGAE